MVDGLIVPETKDNSTQARVLQRGVHIERVESMCNLIKCADHLLRHDSHSSATCQYSSRFGPKGTGQTESR